MAALPDGWTAYAAANGRGIGVTTVDSATHAVLKRWTLSMRGPTVFGSRLLAHPGGVALWNTEAIHRIALP